VVKQVRDERDAVFKVDIKAWDLAVHSANIGESELAFELLERMFRSRDPNLIILGVNPVFDPLRSDPRFDDLLLRMNYPGI
jgi:hypothetical protein